MRFFVGALLTFVSTLLAAAQGAPITPVIVTGVAAARADSALGQLVPNGFSGVVLVAKNGEIVLRKGYGLAVRERKQSFAPATVVQIGSNTKDFTAVAILQLQERGQLDVHDSIGKYIADVPADKRGITIWDLVTHRSGLPLYSGLDFDSVTRADFLRKAMALTLEFPPGSAQRYSNVGYSVLAAIIEMITGDSYGGTVNKNIWTPLGMSQTGLLLVKWDTTLLAHGYQGGEDAGTMLDKPHAANGPYWNIRGNGGYLSTVDDMYHFYDVLFNSAKLLKPATRDLRFDPARPIALAGSDMVNFFLYERAPVAGVVLIMATNASDYPAPKARDAVASAFGLPAMGARGGMRVGGPPPKASGGAAPTAIALPDTPAGRQAQAYVEVFNAADTAAVKRFIQERMVPRADDHRTMEQRLSSYRGMRAQVGTLTPVAIVSSAPTEIVLKVVAGNGDDATLTVEVEPASPHRIASLRIEAN